MPSFDTPYGKADKRTILGKGVTAYKIRRLTYYHLLREQNDKIPRTLRQYTGWYTGIYARILPICYPEYFSNQEVSKARNFYRTHHANMYEEFLGGTIKVIPTKLASINKYKDWFFTRNKSNYIEIVSWSRDPKIEEGYVLIEAALGGDVKNDDVRYFLIPEEDYIKEKGEYGFVCIPGIHEECDVEHA